MKILNKILNAEKKIAKNKTILVPPVKINQPEDIVELSTKTSSKKASRFTLIKNIIKSKMVNLDHKSVMELENGDFGEYLWKIHKLISDSLGIPKELRAQMFIDDLDKKTAMCFIPNANCIVINSSFISKKNYQIFAGLRHEFEHQKQWFDIYRTEGLGDDAVKIFAKERTKNEIKNFTDFYDSQISRANGTYDKFINELSEKINKESIEIYDKYRQKIVKNMGIIHAGTQEAKSARLNFESFVKMHFNSARSGSEIYTPYEQEAYLAEFAAQIEYILAKWRK